MSRRRRKDDFGILAVLVGIFIISRYKKKKRKEIIVPTDEPIEHPEYSTICLREKELSALKRAISKGNQYTWQNVIDVERIGKCDPRTGEMDRESSCYGYRVLYDNGTQRLISIASEYVEE